MKPTEQPDGYWIAVSGRGGNKRKHTNEDCEMLKSASNPTWKPASAIEPLETCQMCTGEIVEHRGGSSDTDVCPLCGEEGISRLPSHLPCEE